MNIVEPEPTGLPQVGRRGFIAGIGAAGGFALAVQLVSAETITTGADGLTAGWVEIQASDRKIPAYRAYPAGKPAAPTVLVVSEIFGVHAHIADVCRRLAKLGYYAIAMEHFVRAGDVKNADMQGVMALVSRIADKDVMADLDASVAFAKSEGALTDRLAITGFCWGGRITWLYAAHNPNLKAGVAWYGRVTGDRDPALRPAHPVDLVDRIKAPILGLYGGADQGIPAAGVKEFEAKLKAAGNARSDVIVYLDAPHAFHADYRPSYRAEPAKDGWARLQKWLKDNGV